MSYPILGRYEEAIADAEKAIEAYPTSIYSYTILAAVYELQKQWEKVIEI